MFENGENGSFFRSTFSVGNRLEKAVAQGKKAVFAPFSADPSMHGNNSKNIHSAVTTVLSNVAIINL